MEGQSDIVIPIIDLNPFINGNTQQRREVAMSIARACEDIGFFIIKNSGVDQRIIDDTWNVTTEFFDRPDSEKAELTKSQDEYPFVPVFTKG